MTESIRQRATGIIIQGDSVLMIKRVYCGEEGYIFPGGGVDEGETVEQALVREMREELVITADEYKLLQAIEDCDRPSWKSPSETQRCYCYCIKSYSGTPQIGPEERAKSTKDKQYHVVWIPISELNRLPDVYPCKVIPIVEEYAKKR